MKTHSAAPPTRVSVHGGHSRAYCNHAEDDLEEILKQYIRKGFEWVGITEHMPPVNDRFRYPDEIEAGLTAQTMYDRFGQYMDECRRLQKKYAFDITLYAAFETETYSGSLAFVQDLREIYRPDYLLGSVHHVDDIPFDMDPAQYYRAAEQAGGLDALYCRYFDLQFEMIEALSPAVVAHFDLIRIFDPDYRTRLEKAAILERIERNLTLIRERDLILDFNVRSLMKGAVEPYISRSILQLALEMSIPVVPGDDSHSVGTVGLNLDRGIAMLAEMGFDTRWRRPA
ncbi:MAG: histidinol-phosphatase [Thermodesulfobacteriota bacterium]